jgi:hypothetical protein
MLQRCTNPNVDKYADYGGRGIRVCDDWRDFTIFLCDMGECPPGLTLERKDNEKGYNKENCRWATIAEQRQNTRASRYMTHDNQTHCVAEWARILGIKRDTIYMRLFRNWPMEQVLGKPVGAPRESRI